jgi:hypothetical protein
MSIAAMNPFMGELIQTQSPGVNCIWLQAADYQISPVAVSNTYVLAATALTASTQTILTGITNPDVPRNVTYKGALSTSTGNVTVTGTDFAGNAITETVSLSGTTVVAGSKAFTTITEIDLPVSSGSGDTVSIGIGTKLGLPFTLSKNTVRTAYNNNVIEATAPTVTVDANNISNNTVTLGSTLAGNVVDIILLIPG